MLVDTFLDSFDEPPEEIILDYDATDDPTHGNQDRRYFNGFYDGYCFLPLYVFCGDQILVSYLRPSSVGAAHHARGVTKLLVQKIRSRWPGVRIIVRGDSGFAIERLMRWCDKNDVGYVFGLAKNEALLPNIACEMTRARIRYADLGIKQSLFKWFRYRTQKTWDRHRWVIGKAEYGSKGPNPRFVVTNLPSDEGIVDATYHRPRIDGKQVKRLKDPGTICSVARNPEEFYQTMYCPRGEMENRIKEQQLCLFADRTSCTRFMANQFRLMLSSLAYVLVDGLRRLALSGTNPASAASPLARRHDPASAAEDRRTGSRELPAWCSIWRAIAHRRRSSVVSWRDCVVATSSTHRGVESVPRSEVLRARFDANRESHHREEGRASRFFVRDSAESASRFPQNGTT